MDDGLTLKKAPTGTCRITVLIGEGGEYPTFREAEQFVLVNEIGRIMCPSPETPGPRDLPVYASSLLLPDGTMVHDDQSYGTLAEFIQKLAEHAYESALSDEKEP